MTKNIKKGFARLMPLFMIAIMVSSLFLFLAVQQSTVTPVYAAEDIDVASTKILDSNTIEITYADPSHVLSSCDGTKVHIDVNTGGSTPLTGTGCAITDAGAWKMTVDFSGTPFSDTATAYDASHGLYLEASAVTDAGADTNTVVAHGSSTAIDDGQAPAYVSSETLDNDNDGTVDYVKIVYSEALSDASVIAGDFEAGITASTAGLLTESFTSTTPSSGNETDVADDATIYIGVTSNSETISANKTDYLLKIEQVGAVTDGTNSLATFATKDSTDGAAPAYVSSETLDNDNDGTVDYVKIVYSEALSDASVIAGDFEAGITASTAGLLTESFTSTTPSSGNETDVADDATIYIGVTSNSETISANKTDYLLKIEQVGAVTDGTNSLATFATKDSTDGAAPALLGAITQDTDDNGKLDHLELLFSEALDDSAINLYSAGTDYSPSTLALAVVGGAAVEATEGTCTNDIAEDDEYLCISFTEDAGTCDGTSQAGCDTEKVDQDVTWTGASATIQDAATNATGNVIGGTVTEVDEADPVLTGLTIGLSNYLNRLTFSYSEAVTLSSGDGASTSSCGDTTSAGTVAGLGSFAAGDVTVPTTLNTVGGSGTDTITLDLASQSGGYMNTGSTTELSGIFTPIAGVAVLDGSSNQVNVNGTPNTIGGGWDLTKPTLTSVTIYDFDGDGQNDRAIVIFDEDVRDSSITDADADLGSTGTTTGAFTTGAPDDDITIFDRTDDTNGIDTSTATSDFTYSGSTTLIADLAGNLLDTTTPGTIASGDSDIIEADSSKPIVVNHYSLDLDGDGSIDAVDVEFSEGISDANANTAISGNEIEFDDDSTNDGNGEEYATSGSSTVLYPSADSDANDEYFRFILTNGAEVFGSEAAYMHILGTTLIDTIGNGIVVADDVGTPNDKAVPILLSFTSDEADATYGPGDNINVIATYSENISTGTVGITFDTTESDTLTTISTNTIYDNYTVGSTGSGDSTDLTVSSISSQSAEDSSANVNSTTTLPSTNIADGSAIVVDTTAPIGTVTAGTATLYDGDYDQEITVLYDEAMDNTSIPTITFGATSGGISSNSDGAWGTTTYTDDTWTETFTITDAGEEVTGVTVSSSVATDAVGNAEGTSVSDTFDVDTLNPTLPTVSIDSNNAYNNAPSEIAKVGDTVTLTITSSENVGTPTITIDGNPADSVTGGPTSWIATRVMQTGDNEAVIVFTIDFDDIIGNPGSQITSTTNSTQVTFDETPPTLTSFTSVTADGTYGPGSAINITATYNETLFSGVSPGSIWVQLDNGINVNLGTVSGSTFLDNYVVDITGSGEDSPDLTVSLIPVELVHDLAGNTQSTSIVPGTNIATGSDIVIDTTAPVGYTVVIDQVPINAGNETAVSFTFAGAEPGATYNYSFDDTNGGTPPITGTGTIVGATDQIIGINVSTLDDDPITLTVDLVDPAGNQGPYPTDTATKDVVSPTLLSWDLNLTAATLTMTFDEDVDVSTLTETQITIQDQQSATTFYTLIDSDSVSANAAIIVIPLSATDLAAIMANTGLATDINDSYLSMTSTAVDDENGNPVNAITDAGAMWVNSYTPGTPGTLTPTDVALSSYWINGDVAATITFTNERIISANGIIEIVFPTGFDTSGANTTTSPDVSVDGIFGTTSPIANTVRIVRSGGNPTPALTDVTLQITTVKNPATPGTTGTYTFQTQTSLGSVIDEDTAVPSDALIDPSIPTTPVTPTSGGGGGGGGSAPPTNSDSNTTTSSLAINIDTSEARLTYSRPVQFNTDQITVDVDSNITTVQATGDNGTLTIKPNSKSTISLYVPPSTIVTSDANWAGRIEPPLIRSLTNIHASGEEIIGTDELLERGDVTVLVEVGGGELTFSNEVKLTIPTDLPDGSIVNVFYSRDEKTWEGMNTAVVKDGQVIVMTSHLSYFALEMTDETATIVGDIEEAEALAPSFIDTRGHWAESYIEELASLGVVSGKTSLRFAPNDNITRAELTKIALKALNYSIDPNVGDTYFSDVSSSDWYAPYVVAAKNSGIVKGYEGNIFSPNGYVNRAEALKILIEAAGFAGVDSNFQTNYASKDGWYYVFFPDVLMGEWFAKYVAYAKDFGIVGGYSDGTFRAGNNITRAEVSKIVMKILEMQ